jgi:type I restriction enzyme S subunit
MDKRERDEIMSEIRTSVVSSEDMVSQKRLDASFYEEETLKAKIIIDNFSQENPVSTLEDVSKDIFKKARFKRDYVGEGEGDPYLRPTDMFEFPLTSEKNIKNPPDGLKPEKGEIILTRSGTIGRTLISDEVLSDYILSDDLIRLIPEDGWKGYVYAFLNSWIGQAYLTHDKFGATVKHIDPHQVDKIKLPIVENVKDEVSNKIDKMAECREKAEKLHRESVKLFEEKIEDSLEQEREDIDHSEVFNTVSTDLVKEKKRLDASYFSQESIRGRKIIEELQKTQSNIDEISDLCERIFRPSIHKRDYTTEDKGEPYLTPSQLFMTPITAEKFIKNPPSGLRCQPGWILLSCSGTVGKSIMATEGVSDFIISQNMIRIVPTEGLGGFLYAYMNSWIGKAFLTQDKYGSTIKHIDPEHVEAIPIPRFEELEEELDTKVSKIFELREKADNLEQEAINMIENELEYYLN